MAVVLTVDADRLEGLREPLDLPHEVGGGEPPLPQLAGQGVRGGGEADSVLAQVAEEG